MSDHIGADARAAASLYINAVSSHWDGIVTNATPEQREVFDLAVKMAKGDHPETWNTLCSGPYPPMYATVRPLNGIRDPWLDPPKYVVMVQYLLGDARPLWANYINYAAIELEKRKAGA